jgi:ABC-type multidrug transport system ATPase subunit
MFHRDFFTTRSRSEDMATLETEDTLLEVRNLNMTLGGKDQVLSRLDMTIKEREIMGLLGANGAGKTTLIKVLLGEVGKVPQGSEVYMKGPKGEVISIKRDLKQVRQNIRFCT